MEEDGERYVSISLSQRGNVHGGLLHIFLQASKTTKNNIKTSEESERGKLGLCCQRNSTNPGWTTEPGFQSRAWLWKDVKRTRFKEVCRWVRN